MKKITYPAMLAIVFALVFFAQKGRKETPSRVVTSAQPAEQSANGWVTTQFVGDEQPPYPSASLQKFEDYDVSQMMLEKTLATLRSHASDNALFVKKIDACVMDSTENIHRDLLKLKGRRIDVIGMQHVQGDVTEGDTSEVAKCQSDIVNFLLSEKYEVMFTEDFSSDVGIAAKSKLIADFKREAFDIGAQPTDEEIEKEVYTPSIEVSASLQVFERHPTITVVGVDYYPIKRIQQQLMAFATTADYQEVIAPEEHRNFMRSMTSTRDLYLLRTIANMPEFAGKKSAIVFGAAHAPHLLKLLKSYGASGIVRIESKAASDPYIAELCSSWGVSLR